MNPKLNTLPLAVFATSGPLKPLVIAGPCSAETREQLLSTARALSEIDGIHILRAGIWKPRTRPNSFEGVGEIGLKWLQEVKAETGLLSAVEVAKPAHVELCLKHGIDILWIGARSTANPFTIQELALALKGVDIPVLVKNPVNPDVELWIGALERLNKSGVKRMGVIFRGVFPYEKTHLRNLPRWEMAIEIMRLFPDLTVLCDPSHIAGKKEYVFEIAQRAIDLNFHGLMIESHINPATALSDAAQQLTPLELKGLLQNLKFRTATSQNPEFVSSLEQCREKINSIDFQVLELLGRRMGLVKEIAEYKRRNNVTILQLRRWEDIINTRLAFGHNRGLPDAFIKQLFEMIHKEAIQLQTELMNKPGNGS
ncbi:MAG: bifunctional 3-deoxy-7-phosphoheptulonate synthase/chorismate mutase type II [Deltaproteobacteria bacterium]|nr:bifunctional 3-deoxy-7-phosphoheptulonate synthase/chorismate mutase type II [Deltaproteobacteria bacterium]